MSSASSQGLIVQPLIWRWTALVAVLLVELLGFTIRFDTWSLEGDVRWWAGGLRESPALLRVLLAFAAAFLLLVSPRLRTLTGSMVEESRHHRWWPYLACHFVAIGLFALCTFRLFESSEASALWLLGWVAAGAAAAGLWLLAVSPGRFWLRVARREWAALLLAALIGAASWEAARLAQELWKPLAGATFWLAHHLLEVVHAEVVSEQAGAVLGTPAFRVRIAPECSGYEGIGLIILFVSVYLFLFRERLRFPRALLLLPLGALVIWLANAVRITALIFIGSSFSRDVALGGFHSQAGWLFFLAVSAGVMAVGHRVRFFAVSVGGVDRGPAKAPPSREAAALLTPMLVLLAAVVIAGAFSSGFDWLYPLKVVAIGTALWWFREAYLRLDWRWTWQSAAIGLAVFLMWILLAPRAGAGNGDLQGDLAQLSPIGAAAWIAFRVIGSSITVPLAEELAFRGYLMRKLVSKDFETVRLGSFTWMSFLISSVLFGLMHGEAWLAGALAGMAYAAALCRRGRLAEAVYAHMTTNALIAAYVLCFDQWWLW